MKNITITLELTDAELRALWWYLMTFNHQAIKRELPNPTPQKETIAVTDKLHELLGSYL